MSKNLTCVKEENALTDKSDVIFTINIETYKRKYKSLNFFL